MIIYNGSGHAKCSVCGEFCPEPDGLKREDKFLCSLCRLENEFCTGCGKIVNNDHVYTVDDGGTGSFCIDCMREDLSGECARAKGS